MALKNSYEYIRECCGTFVFKQSIMDLKDTIIEGAKGETSTMNLQGGGPSYNGGVNGMLYKKTYVNHICGAPHCCGMRSSYEIEGYNTKLAETKIPPCNFCTCTPEFEVVDGQEKALGHMKHNCIGLFIPCCLELHVTTFNRPQTYVIPRPCCVCTPCCRKWEVKDGTGNQVAEVTYDGGLCMWKAQYQVNFFGNMSNQDKLLFLSSIPFLP